MLKRPHYPLDLTLTRVRWYVAYPLSLRHLEEIMAERGVSVVATKPVTRLMVVDSCVQMQTRRKP